jgi:hypothetical protein
MGFNCHNLECFFSCAMFFRGPRIWAALVCLATTASSSSGIDWMPLDAALAKAKADHKPVYVLVTSRLSELTRETYESLKTPETADYFAAHFECVRLDRDERPDFAAAVQQYLYRVKQQSGWPAHVWLTPDGQPYDGANYLPPAEEWGKKSLSEVARRNGDLWEHSAPVCQREAKSALTVLRVRPILTSFRDSRIAGLVDEGFTNWSAAYDAVNPGFGDTPRYPEPELLRALLRRGGADRDRAVRVLKALANSGIHDPLDGGFFRYTQDKGGILPYPQKLMADQARLAMALLDAQALQPDPALADAARGALGYVLRRLARPDGLFANAEDGTGVGHESYFAWKAADVAAVLGDRAAAFEAAFAIAPNGNLSTDTDPSGQFAGKNLLRRVGQRGSEADEAALAADEAKLLAARDHRGALAKDDRPLAYAHGLFAAALVQAAQVLKDDRFRAAASRLAPLLHRKFLGPDGSVRHVAGEELPGTATDAAALALGFRSLAHAGIDAQGNAAADALMALCDQKYLSAAGDGYAASALPLAPGVFMRASAFRLADHEVSPEALALLAGPSSAAAPRLRQVLAHRAAASDIVAGDTLLVLER